MPSVKTLTFEHKELAELILKQQNIHEGHWAVYFEFGLIGGMVPLPPDGKHQSPAAIALVNKVGIQRMDAPMDLTVDAAIVNPPSD